MSGENRIPMTMVVRRARAYFGPVQRDMGRPAPFEPTMPELSLPNGNNSRWVDAGWIENLKRSAGTRVETVRTGAKNAVVKQFCTTLEARVEFDFMQWGKLQMALTSCGPQLNVLATSLGTAVPARALKESSTATELFLADTTGFSAGDLIAVDVDYVGQTGYIGSGASGTWVSDPMAVGNDVNYVRRVTLNVGRISGVTSESLILQQPLVCGAPSAEAKVQKVVAFMDREGGSFFPEWSALFEVDSETGGRLCLYYPRLQPAAMAQESNFEIRPPFEGMAIHASFRALPDRDARDGDEVLCYRTYYPAAGSPVY